MNQILTSLSGAAAFACLAALPFAQIATALEPVRGKQAGDLVLGLGVIGVLPDSGGRVDAIGGKPSASDSASPQLDLTWFPRQTCRST